jgi:hypothetical protein
MDPRTGVIYEVENEEEAKRRGLIPIPPEQEASVRGMNRKQRRAWAAKQRRATRSESNTR